jgi:hypothetical protein
VRVVMAALIWGQGPGKAVQISVNLSRLKEGSSHLRGFGRLV